MVSMFEIQSFVIANFNKIVYTFVTGSDEQGWDHVV